MTKIHTLKFRVDHPQYNQIKKNMQERGHINKSAYLREVALQKNKLMESIITDTNNMVNEIYNLIKNIK